MADSGFASPPDALPGRALPGFRPHVQLARFLDVRRWPPTTQMIALSIGLSAALALALTLMGYAYASRGLQQEADAALSSDALVALNAIDAWNAGHIATLAADATLPAIEQYAQAGANADPAVKEAAEGSLTALARAALPELSSLALVLPDRTVLFDSDTVTPTAVVPDSDYFRSAVGGMPFASSITVSQVTDKPSLYHAVPVRNAQGVIVGVLRSRSTLGAVTAAVINAKDRVGKHSLGLLIGPDGLVIADSRDRSWEQRPVAPLSDEQLAALVADSRWGNHPPAPPLDQRELARAWRLKRNAAFTWHLDGELYHAHVVRLHETPWAYVVALPQAAYEASAQTFLRNATIGASVALVITAVLAVVLARMLARERRHFLEREQQLSRKVEALQLEIDEARRARDVKQIVESEFFQDLTGKARQMRAQRERRVSSGASAVSQANPVSPS